MRTRLSVEHHLQPVAIMPPKTNGASSRPWTSALHALARRTFFVQVMLAGGDYDRLWLALCELGYRRCIRGESGLFRLPQGIFKLDSTDDADAVIQSVVACMNALQLVGQVVAFRADSICWAGLELDHDASIRASMARSDARPM